MQITGGGKAEAYLADLAKKIGAGRVLRVGFLKDATYPDGTPVAMVAALQNFGTGRIPPRPFFSNMVAEKSPEWGPALAALMKANDNDATKCLKLMGEGIRGQLMQSIVDTNSPPLAPITVARKGFDKPLVDTGQMLNSVDYDGVG